VADLERNFALGQTGRRNQEGYQNAITYATHVLPRC
jgi:hypothetical protein